MAPNRAYGVDADQLYYRPVIEYLKEHGLATPDAGDDSIPEVIKNASVAKVSHVIEMSQYVKKRYDDIINLVEARLKDKTVKVDTKAQPELAQALSTMGFAPTEITYPVYKSCLLQKANDSGTSEGETILDAYEVALGGVDGDIAVDVTQEAFIGRSQWMKFDKTTVEGLGKLLDPAITSDSLDYARQVEEKRDTQWLTLEKAGEKLARELAATGQEILDAKKPQADGTVTPVPDFLKETYLEKKIRVEEIDRQTAEMRASPLAVAAYTAWDRAKTTGSYLDYIYQLLLNNVNDSLDGSIRCFVTKLMSSVIPGTGDDTLTSLQAEVIDRMELMKKYLGQLAGYLKTAKALLSFATYTYTVDLKKLEKVIVGLIVQLVTPVINNLIVQVSDARQRLTTPAYDFINKLKAQPGLECLPVETLGGILVETVSDLENKFDAVMFECLKVTQNLSFNWQNKAISLGKKQWFQHAYEVICAVERTITTDVETINKMESWLDYDKWLDNLILVNGWDVHWNSDTGPSGKGQFEAPGVQ